MPSAVTVQSRAGFSPASLIDAVKNKEAGPLPRIPPYM
jgi:hypothetical protein